MPMQQTSTNNITEITANEVKVVLQTAGIDGYLFVLAAYGTLKGVDNQERQ